MNNFMKAMRTNDTRTEKGMVAHSTTGSEVLDLFYKIGATRTMQEFDIVNMFSIALNVDSLIAMKILFYNRDVRGGQGERRSFRTILAWLANSYPELVVKNLSIIPKYGRYDDLLVLLDSGERVRKATVALIREALFEKRDGLCAKWMPREGKANDRCAKMLMKELHLTPRSYRKLLSRLSSTVETQMCNKEWTNINYNHVPSVASNRYRSAFLRNDESRYRDWLGKLERGEKGVKINASAIYPYDITKAYTSSIGYYSYNLKKVEDKTLEAQWKNLPDFVKSGDSFMPVVDTSGSMYGAGKPAPIDVALSLGIYLAERNKSAFRNNVITFSTTPTFHDIGNGSLLSKLSSLKDASWSGTTNFVGIFETLLRRALSYNVAEVDMPRTLVVLSDMQFDSAFGTYRSGGRVSLTAMQSIEVMYRNAGYRIPNVVFWNLRATGNVPVKHNEYGVALVSGFSPSTMQNVLGGEMSPDKVMHKVLEKYSDVRV